jgi:hypothetical protein
MTGGGYVANNRDVKKSVVYYKMMLFQWSPTTYISFYKNQHSLMAKENLLQLQHV